MEHATEICQCFWSDTHMKQSFEVGKLIKLMFPAVCASRL